MSGLNLGRSTVSNTYVQPSNPPSAAGTTATDLAFGGSQQGATSNSVKTATIAGVSFGTISLVLLVLIWHSLPR